MSRPTHSHITVVLDRTGSMADIRDDVIGGFNSFLAAQQAQPDPATFMLVQFDSQDPFEVVQPPVPIAEAHPLTAETYVPRASTPLYDAIGRGISDLEARLSRQPASERPGKVVFVIVTDGQENSSREFDRARVMAMIGKKRKAGWQFVFLSADVESFEDARGIGMHHQSRLLFSKTRRGNQAAWDSVSDKMARFRSGAVADVHFDDQDRANQDEAKPS